MLLLETTPSENFLEMRLRRQSWKRTLKAKLEALAKATAEKYDVEISHGVAHGKIYDQIVNAANVLDSSFIVMGTNGSVGLKGRFIGSNALRVVRESKNPCDYHKRKIP